MVERVKLVPKTHKTPFVKGNRYGVGNKGLTMQAKQDRKFISSAIEAALLKTVEDPTLNHKQKCRRIDKLVEKMCQEAEMGNVHAFNALVDRVEGKPMQAHEIGTKDGQPLPHLHLGLTLTEMTRIYNQTLIERRKD
jgi:hypothetical protein